MPARDDLLFLAAHFAAQARVHVDPPPMKRNVSAGPFVGELGEYPSLRPATENVPGAPNTDAAVPLAHAAKSALEAAALVDAEPAPIIAATERLHEKLEALGEAAGLDVAAQFGAAEAIDAVGDVVEHLVREIRTAASLTDSYSDLRELLEGLERDFTAAETETASRIAARIHGGLEEAEQSISNAQRGEG